MRGTAYSPWWKERCFTDYENTWRVTPWRCAESYMENLMSNGFSIGFKIGGYPRINGCEK